MNIALIASVQSKPCLPYSIAYRLNPILSTSIKSIEFSTHFYLCVFASTLSLTLSILLETLQKTFYTLNQPSASVCLCRRRVLRATTSDHQTFSILWEPYVHVVICVVRPYTANVNKNSEIRPNTKRRRRPAAIAAVAKEP